MFDSLYLLTVVSASAIGMVPRKCRKGRIKCRSNWAIADMRRESVDT